MLEEAKGEVIREGDFLVSPKNVPNYEAAAVLHEVAEHEDVKRIGEVISSTDDIMTWAERNRAKHEAEVEQAMESARVAHIREKLKPISFIAITREEDAMLLVNMIASLPKFTEVCVVVTRKADAESFEIDGEYTEDDRIIRMASWNYKNFSFAKARNHSIDLATNDWVMWMDSDDIMPSHIHGDVLKIPQLERGIGGVEFGVMGFHSAFETGGEGEYYCAPHLRAFKKSTGARFKGLVHEQIRPQLDEMKVPVFRSHMVIHHTGYIASPKALEHKLQRNLTLLRLQCATSNYLQRYYDETLAKTITAYHQLQGN